MLRVFKASGEEALAIEFSELVEMLDEEPITGLVLKRHLRRVCGQTRFKQRLLLVDGQKLLDDAVLGFGMDLQLVLLPFEASSNDHVIQLQQIAEDGDVGAMEQLLQRPQDPDLGFGGWFALHAACMHGHPAAAGLLLEASAEQDQALANGITPVFTASQRGHLEVVKLLLEASADKDKARDDGRTPMFIASQKGHLAVVRLLLAASADKDKATAIGVTPVFIASARGRLEVVRLLLEASTDQNKASSPCISRPSKRPRKYN